MAPDARARDLPTIVLVVLDTARWDRVGCYGYERPTTPTLDSLARGGLRVQAMVSNAPWTLPSHASLFTGLYPSQHGSQWRTGPKLRPSVKTTMAEWLGSLGYQTWCVTNNGMISGRTGLARGFDRYLSRLDLELGWRRRARRAEKVVRGGDSGGRIVNAWMRRELPRARRPLFLFVNYLECHWAYAPPPRFVRQVGGPKYGSLGGLRYRAGVAARVGPWEAVARAEPRDLEIMSTYYDAELANADSHVEELLEILRGTGHVGDDGRSLVIVTSDHGEHLGEHGLADHHASLDELMCRVPFVAWGPGIVEGGVVHESLAEFVDVMPSLGRLLDEPVSFDGLSERRTDLFGEGSDGRTYAFSEWKAWSDRERARLARRNPSYRGFDRLAQDLVSARDSRFKLVRFGSREELFDLERDPTESADVASEHPQELAALREQLDEHLAEWAEWEVAETEITPRERAEIERRLEDLGYI